MDVREDHFLEMLSAANHAISLLVEEHCLLTTELKQCKAELAKLTKEFHP